MCWFCRLLSISLYWLHSASSNHNRIKSHVETLFEYSFVGPIFCNGMYEAYFNDVRNKTVQNVVMSNQLISVTSKDEELCMMTSSNGNFSCVAIEWGYDAVKNNTILHTSLQELGENTDQIPDPQKTPPPTSPWPPPPPPPPYLALTGELRCVFNLWKFWKGVIAAPLCILCMRESSFLSSFLSPCQFLSFKLGLDIFL